ncbi:MAG: 16S rRNA (guanine(966)-N(2))-methyltransferase RsmD [Spirochaetota bacterium]
MKKLLKLTGGSYTGRRLYVPGTGTRPATNRTREAIFSTLYLFFSQGMEGLNILDLFAGTGSLGLEALSRGASTVTFLDNSTQSILAIRKNLSLLGLEANVIKADAEEYLKKNTRLFFDLIFMDPPYKYNRTPQVVHLLAKSLKSDHSSVLVYERFYQQPLPDFDNRVEFLRRKKYGQTELLYYKI